MDSKKSDEEIVQMALVERAHFAILIGRYERKLARYIRRLGIVHTEDIEDVLQNVFIKTYRNLHGFDTSLSFSSWVYRIAHNEAVSFLRKKKPVLESDIVEEGDTGFFERIAGELSTDDAAEKRLEARRIARAMEKIESKYREVLVLRFFEERDYQDISDILEMPMGSVATLIHRAKKALRNKLQEQT